MMTGSKQESITDLIRLLLKIIVRTQATRKGARLRQKEGKKKKKKKWPLRRSELLIPAERVINELHFETNF